MGQFAKRGAVFKSFNTTSNGFTFDNGCKMPVGGNQLQFCHTVSKARWPFDKMVSYLSKASPTKTIDTTPLIFKMEEIDGEWFNQQVSAVQLNELYNSTYGKAAGLLARAAEVREMAEDGASRADVIQVILPNITKDNAYEFNILLELFKATSMISEVPVIPDWVPRPWQDLIIRWILTPADIKDTNKRGIWLCCKAGEGKSSLIDMIRTAAGYDKVFIPAKRNGTYTTMSMTGYNKEPIIAIDDSRAYTDEQGHTQHKSTIIEFIKAIASGDDMVYTMYNTRYFYKPLAKILITSNFPLPTSHMEEEQAAINRRYIDIDNTDADRIAGILRVPRVLGTNAAGTHLQGVLPNPENSSPAVHLAGLTTPPASPVDDRAGPNDIVDLTTPGSGNPRPRASRRLDYQDGVEESKDTQPATQTMHASQDEDILMCYSEEEEDNSQLKD